MPASRTCPICKRPVGEGEAELRFRPFCSKRCADVDLGRWLKGGYAIPATDAEDDDGDGPSGESPDDEAPQVRH